MTGRPSTFIYALTCPDTGDIRYIGKANDLESRLKSHVYESSKRNRPVCKWIKGLVSCGKTPVIKLIEECSIECWPEVERKWISFFRLSCKDLLNVASGGDQPSQTIEQRRLNGSRNANKIHKDPELKRLWELKLNAGQMLAWLLKNGSPERIEYFKSAMRYAAARRPLVFGKWATI